MKACPASPPYARARFHQGVSLVELMVALAIGLVVIGAVFTNYLNNAAGTRQTSALTQVTSDASLALGILRNHIAIAGYGNPKGVLPAKIETDFTGPAVLGCDNGFASLSADIGAISCASPPSSTATKPSPGNSLLVRYVTDSDISPESETDTGSAKTKGPTDCTGKPVTVPAGSTSPLIADSRFQIRPVSASNTVPSLDCNNVELVENVESMQILYGIGSPDAAGGSGKLARVQRYLTAEQVGAPGAAGNKWGDVLSVRICVVVRSADEVLSAATPYMGCTQSVVSNTSTTDRRIRRAFTSTVLINNRLSSQALQPS
jgi:type IV pilus assembly protein PilW